MKTYTATLQAHDLAQDEKFWLDITFEITDEKENVHQVARREFEISSEEFDAIIEGRIDSDIAEFEDLTLYATGRDGDYYFGTWEGEF